MQWRTNGFLERLEAIGVNWPENARNISLSCPFSATFRLSSTVFDLKILAHKLSKKIIKNAWFHLLHWLIFFTNFVLSMYIVFRKGQKIETGILATSIHVVHFFFCGIFCCKKTSLLNRLIV